MGRLNELSRACCGASPSRFKKNFRRNSLAQHCAQDWARDWRALALTHLKRKKEIDNPREGWEDGTPPPHRGFKERGVVR